MLKLMQKSKLAFLFLALPLALIATALASPLHAQSISVQREQDVPNDTAKNQEPAQEEEINWLTDYGQALEQAKKENKPIFLYFTGSDWCGWCMKFNKEILSSPEFVKMMGSKLVFLKVDFPRKTTLPPAQKEHNESLKRRFGVVSFPTVILLTPKEEVIARTGYFPGGGQKYAERLQELISKSKELLSAVEQLDVEPASLEKLEGLYAFARAQGRFDLAEKIADKALKEHESIFFIKEKISTLAANGQLQTEETEKLKTKLLTLDPQNTAGCHYFVAVLNFTQNACNQELTPEQVAAPLANYLETFGKTDKSNTWRAELALAQYYASQRLLKDAVKMAECAKKDAPKESWQHIDQAISSFGKGMDGIR